MDARLRWVAKRERLQDVIGWLDQRCRELELAGDLRARLAIVVEEITSNVASYGGGPPPPTVEIALRASRAQVELTVEDDGAAFDPTTAPAQDLTARAAAGGQGVRLICALMDEVSYARAAGRNRLTLRKSREAR